MSALQSPVGHDVVLRSRHVFRASLRFLPLHGLIVGHAPWLDWIPPLFRYLGEYYDRVAPRVEGYYDLPESDATLVGAIFVW